MFRVDGKPQTYDDVLKTLNKVSKANNETRIIKNDLSIQKLRNNSTVFSNETNNHEVKKQLFSLKTQILNLKRADPTFDASKYEALKDTFNAAVKQFNSLSPENRLQPISDQTPRTPSGISGVEKLDQANILLNKLAEGASLDDLLLEAVQNGQVESAQYLVQQGADLQVLNGPLATPHEEEIKNWLDKWAAAPEIKPENLNYYAIDLGLGYKTANLMVLEKKAEKINETLVSCEMKVPPFLSIGDFEMQHALMRDLPELETLWEQFKDSFDPETKEQFLKAAAEGDASKVPLKVSAQGQKIIDEIQTKITGYFKDKPYLSKQMEDWLKKENPQFLIVRSTGKEDSDINSNAGGNDSVPFIRPDAHDISKAIGQVISSYFGAKSIGQRLLAGDQSIFTEKPFIPVLLQVMVGENIGGEDSSPEDVPRSGVLFSRQGDKAEGVTLIQTGLGNNEGVVSCRVEVDSYYVGSDKNIHSVVRKKATRFVSVEKTPGKYAAEPIKNNNPTLENSQALPNSVIQDLKRVADDISASYGAENGGMKPMDMEYSVKLRDSSTTKRVSVQGKEFTKDKPVIYLLQARPLLQTTTTPVPKSFLDLQALRNVKNKNKLSAETLLDGNAYVRSIDKADDVLFVDTLEQGLEAYNHAPDPSKIKAIISKQMGTATSHPAVILQPKGIAVMVISDQDQYAQAKEMIQKADPAKPVLLDPQRGMIVNTEGVNNPQDMIKIGVVSYPIPLEMTVPLPSWILAAYQMGLHPNPKNKAHIETVLKVQLQTLNDDYSKFMQELQAIGPLPALANAANPDGATLRSLFDDMAMKSEKDAKLALGAILQILHKRLIKSMHETEDFRSSLHLQTVQVFQEALRLAREEIVPAIENHEPQTLNRLYPIKFLDALIFQKPSQNVVGGFSYAKVLQTDKIERAAVQKGKTKGVEFSGPKALQQLQLMNMANSAFNPKLGEHWETFVQGVADQGQIDALTPMIREITQLNLNATWLNVSFRKAWETHKGDVKLVLATLQSQYTQDQETLKWVAEMHKDLAILENNIKAWENPDYVKKQIENLKNKYVQLGFDLNDTAKSFVGRYKDQSGELGKLALLQYMHRAINIYDNTIKAVKGSSLYPEDAQEKRRDFGLLLEGYYQLLLVSMTLVHPDDAEELMTPNLAAPMSFNEYEDGLRNGIAYRFGDFKHTSVGLEQVLTDAINFTGNAEEQLQARPEFNVEAIIIGSKADLNFSAHWPSRMEEYFTTLHQNMEKINKFLLTKQGFNSSILADEVKAVCADIQKRVPDRGVYSYELSAEVSHISQEGDKIEVVYQVPLRQHAGTIKIRYNSKEADQGYDISMEMFGNHEHNRWDQTATVGALLANFWGLSYTDNTKPKINYKGTREGVSFSLHIPTNFSKKTDLINCFRYIMKEMTMDPCFEKVIDYMAFYTQLDDWEKVPDTFFQDAYNISGGLLNGYAEVDDCNFTRRVAANSLLGLAKNGLSDYKLGVEKIALPDYFGNPKYAYVPGSQDVSSYSLVTGSTLHLIRSLTVDYEATLPVIQQLIADPDMQKTLPDTVAALQEALRSTLPIEEQFQYALEHNLAKAIAIAWEEKEPNWAQTVQSKFMVMTPAEQTAEVHKLISARQLEPLFDWVVPHLPVGSPTLALIPKTSPQRAQLYADLDTNISALQKIAKSFDSYANIVTDLCARTLIGMSQHYFFDESYGAFPELEDYIDNPKYDYVNNDDMTTTQLSTVAPLYLIKAMEHPATRGVATRAFLHLIVDYKAYSKYSEHSKSVEHLLLGLSQAFAKTSKNEEIACKQLAQLWGHDKAALQKLLPDDNKGVIQKIIKYCSS